MQITLAILIAATLTLALGLGLRLPRASAVGRAVGLTLIAVSLGLFASRVPRLESWASDSLFLILAAVTVLAAVGTVTYRNPVYAAIWFALSLLGTAGLFLFQGAQFLAVATVVVYAGAILVTFLFVLMLAQPQGNAPYDRVSWAPYLAAGSGALMVGVLSLGLVGVFSNPEFRPQPPRDATAAHDILADQHMAELGAQLFGKHLVAIEVAGTLLLVALVGAVAIVAQMRQTAGRVGPRPQGASLDPREGQR